MAEPQKPRMQWFCPKVRHPDHACSGILADFPFLMRNGTSQRSRLHTHVNGIWLRGLWHKLTAWERPEPTGNHLAYFRHAPPNPLLFLASTHRLRASNPAQWPEQALLCCSGRPAGGLGRLAARPTPRLHGPSETQFLRRGWA